MTLILAITLINYGLVMLFGHFLSISVAGGCETKSQQRHAVVWAAILLATQGIIALRWDVGTVEAYYPLITHFPLFLFLKFGLKKRAGVALVSISTAYLCCQLPHWVNLLAEAAFDSPLIGQFAYTLSILPIFFLLRHYFTHTAYKAMTYSRQSLILFGSLPSIYYLFDYVSTVYTTALYERSQTFVEFLPTLLILFYIMFITAYHTQTQKRNQAELHRSILEAAIRKTGNEIDTLKQIKTQAAIYQHDMRHHMNMICGYLSANKTSQALEYIQEVQDNVSAIFPKRYCENEAANLLCSSFFDKAKQQGVNLSIDATLPKNLCLTDTELCSILSNGLENALNAVSALEEGSSKWITLYCGILANKLLIEIRNPYKGQIIMSGDVPVSTSDQEHHGYGCKSICAITLQYNGLYSFEPDNGIFTLRIMLPVHK